MFSNLLSTLAGPTLKDDVQNIEHDGLIAIHGLKKSYHTGSGEAPALRGVNLQIEPGEFTVIEGKSGAGKSTLINIVAGILKADQGDILIDGTAIHALNEDQMAMWRGRTMGVVFQFFQLMPSLTLTENIMLAMDFPNSFPLSERRARAMYLLDQVGIADHADKTPSRISGGQQQRVAIARALANNPKLIVADEPTGNLDSRTTDDIFKVFMDVVEQHGTTLLMVTHDHDIAERAHHVLELADGLVVNEYWN